MVLAVFYTILIILCFRGIFSAHIHLNISFSNSSLNPSWFVGDENFAASNHIFGINYYTCMSELGTESCPGKQATFQTENWVTTDDQVSNNNWMKIIDIGDTYTGKVVIDIYAPLPYTITKSNSIVFSSSVFACFKSKEDYEMSAEICGQHGQPWTVNIKETSDVISVNMFPAFGLSATGNTSILLKSFNSTQLNNSRDIPVYQPPSLLQNKMKRPINIMIVLDGSFAVVKNYAIRTGFESHQLMGVVPESIMIGISQIKFEYELDFNQRTYEMTYDNVSLSFPYESCIDGNYSKTGGASKLLDWIDEDVIPAVLANIGEEGIGMDRGEVTIHGGSLGGLTSCYAATYKPDVFARAICSSPTNCFNFGSGGLSTLIVDNYKDTGKSPKAVIQFIGAESYGVDGTTVKTGLYNDQLGYMMKDDEAWQDIGLIPYSLTKVYTEADSSKNIRFPYKTLEPITDEHIVASIYIPAGQHAPSTWQQEFALALTSIYRNDPYDKIRIPMSESFKYMSDQSLNTNDNNDDDSSNALNDTSIALLVCFVFTFICLMASIGYIYKLQYEIKSSNVINNDKQIHQINPINNIAVVI